MRLTMTFRFPTGVALHALMFLWVVLLSTEACGKGLYPGIPRCGIYQVKVDLKKSPVFQNACPVFKLGKQGMLAKDRKPLKLHAGRSISWTNIALHQPVEVEVTLLNTKRVQPSDRVRILPSRHKVKAEVKGNVIRFTLRKPGQYSVEIGEKGYRNGLMIFANPPEKDKPGNNKTYARFDGATASQLSHGAQGRSGIYFEKGHHKIGIYKVPEHIKNIYFERGAWVDGALILDGNRDVKIFGRGVLSSRHIDYRAAHGIEAINRASRIKVEGITVADFKHFGLRMVSTHTSVQWVKVIGAWLWNMDGISVRDHSKVQHCFIWANDDAIKPYRHNILFEDIVVWQLDNGGTIQMSWGNSKASDVVIRRVDLLRADWDRPGFNRGLLNCVGNRYQKEDVSTVLQNWLIEDLVTENPVPVIFKISPYEHAPVTLDGLTLRNWNVKMTRGTKFQNEIIGLNTRMAFRGLVFDRIIFNGDRLTQDAWRKQLNGVFSNIHEPLVK